MPPTLQLHLLVVVLASTAILGRLMQLPAAGIVFWRTLLASAGAAAIVFLMRQPRHTQSRRTIFSLIGIGGLIGLHWVCFFGSIQLSNISISLAGMATISLFTAFTEPLLEKKPIQPGQVGLGLLVLVGLVLVAGSIKGSLIGLTVSLIGTLLAAIFPVLNRRVVHRERPPTVLTIVAWEMLGANLTILLLLPLLTGQLATPWQAYQDLFHVRPIDWLWLILISWGCTVFAHGFHIHLLRKLSAYTSNLAITFEPVWGIMAAALIFGEHHELRPGFYLGAIAILLANLLHAVIPAWKRKSKV